MKNYCYSCMEEITQGDFCTNCMKSNEADNFTHHLRPGTVLNNKYIVGNCLGEGGFGITYIGRDLTLDIKVAIKEYYPNGYVNRNNETTQMVTTTTETQTTFFNKGKERFLQEARNLAKFYGEPGIVGVREYFECNNTAYIIMEYLDGENLSTYIKENGNFAPETIFRLILPVVRSLNNIHKEGIIHRDIAPDNIMYLKNGTLKLMDFGSARFFTNEEKEMSVMLKLGYAPEEQYRKNGNQGPWTDVYGLCATLYKCITGTTPEDALDRKNTDDLKSPSELGVAITKPLEIVLMYGLAVIKENRCPDMVTLEDLIQKALAKQNIPAPIEHNAQVDHDKTQAADDVYRTQVAEYFEDQSQNRQVVDSGMDFNPNRNVTPVKSPGNKAVAAVVTASIIIVLLVLGLLYYVLFAMPNSSSDESDEEVETTQATVEETVEETQAVTTIATVTMPSCVNKNLAVAKQDLTNLGLTVKEKYEFNNTVTKDYVISQNIAQGMEVSVGDTIVLTVSKGPDICPYDYSQKLTVTAESDSSYGTATLYQWSNGDWEEQSTYSCALGSNGIGVAREGSSTTPQGLHRLGAVLTAYSVDTNMPVYKATSDTVVIDDASSPWYNRIFERNFAPAGEGYDNIGKGLTNGTTYAMVYIEHNGSGFSSDGVVHGNGSAIGLRGQYGSLSPTYGDVDLSSGDLIDLLRRLDTNRNPVIEIKVE